VHVRDEEAGVALRWGEMIIDDQPIFADQMRDDGIAVADGFAVIDDIGNWPRGADEASKIWSCVNGTPVSRRTAKTFRP